MTVVMFMSVQNRDSAKLNIESVLSNTRYFNYDLHDIEFNKKITR
jgi:hypothetical protein